MRGQYLTHRRLRPRLCDDADEALASARLYHCGRCRLQVLICSCCDRGNIYCNKGCAEEARRSAQREAGKRYQSTDRGRRNHAKRAIRFNPTHLEFAGHYRFEPRPVAKGRGNEKGREIALNTNGPKR
jgi:hypothetical protein